ncbi:8-oxo-dGTP diphosphatase [Candidatus Bipolaricaulota bacterium]|nr:8-oxo-dGTP diphosphatase [Candidatus Bipolaricaulota bacterium]
MVEATVCFILDGSPPERILLGLKKRGFGAGKYNGLGGKVLAHETPLKAIVSEVEEESGLILSADHLRPMGSVDFFFPFRREYEQHVHVFLADAWEGEMRETDEMAPTWLAIDEIPHSKMWADDAHWLPLVLAGRRIEAEFAFGEDNETIVSFAICEF